jgi:hypothetical protein
MLLPSLQSVTQVSQLAARKESRRLERFSLKLPTFISVLEPGSPTVNLNLMTENISSGGAFFPTVKPLSEGLKVLVELVLKRESGLGGASRVKVKGEVLRSQPDGMAIRFGRRAQMFPC